jgi:RNA polymerase sigma-70 factor (ECF subfamily)
MSEAPLASGDVTRLLQAWCKGDASALERLAPVIEHELRQVARAYLNKESSGHTLQPTALINEVYVRLLEWNPVNWQSRAHFLAVAAKLMRRILVNHAVARRSEKRGGAAVMVSLNEADGVAVRGQEMIALDEALVELAKFDERKARLVELRYFGGLTAEEAGEVLGISLRTVHREWDLSRAWLFRALRS